jgi:hypothetical protein
MTLIEMFKELDNSSKRHLMRCVVDNMIEAYNDSDPFSAEDRAKDMLEFLVSNLGLEDVGSLVQEMHGGELDQ